MRRCILNSMHVEEWKPDMNNSTVSAPILWFRTCVLILHQLEKTEILQTNYRRLLLYYIPVGLKERFLSNEQDNDEVFLSDLIGEMCSEERTWLTKVFRERKDEYVTFQPEVFLNAIRHYQLAGLADFAERMLEEDDASDRLKALEVLGEECMGKEEGFFVAIFSRKEADQVAWSSLEESANRILIERFDNQEAVEWRFRFLKRTCWEFDWYDFRGTRRVFAEEREMDEPTFLNCIIQKQSEAYVERFMDLLRHSLSLSVERKYWKYSRYLQIMSMDYFKSLHRKEHIYRIRNLAQNHANRLAVQKFYEVLCEAERYILNNREIISIESCIRTYNEIRNKQYMLVRDETDLFYRVSEALGKFQSDVQNQGLYKPVVDSLGRERYPHEGLIQKTLMANVRSCLLEMGLREVDLYREVNLYDDKRTDLLIKYGFIGPVLIEVKWLSNAEIQNEKKRRGYKEKLLQYIRGSHAKYSFYVVFRTALVVAGEKRVGDGESECREMVNYRKLTQEYGDIPGLNFLLIDCLE